MGVEVADIRLVSTHTTEGFPFMLLYKRERFVPETILFRVFAEERNSLEVHNHKDHVKQNSKSRKAYLKLIMQ